jgi:hypothetical protein
LPKGSSKGESSDEFEAHDKPQNLLPGAFINTPKCTPLSSTSALSSLTALSSSSTHSQIATITQKGMPALAKVPFIKQEVHKNVSALHPMRTNTLATNIPPIHPTSSNTPQTNMSAIPFRMPGCATDKAPKFDGKDESLLIFIDDYKDLADQAQLQDMDHIKGLIKYVPTKDCSLWAGIPEANAGDYAMFITVVKDMYHGCESDKHYMVNDLQTVS